MSVRVGEDEGSLYVHAALKHPLRRRIIELLGERGSMSFTDFKKMLAVRVGTLYYHFESLNLLIIQDEQKRYALTELGSRAYQLMRMEETIKSPVVAKLKPSTALLRYVKNLFLPAGFFSILYSKPKFAVIGAFALLAFGALICYQGRLEPIIFFYDRALPAQQTLIPLEFLASWIAIFLLSDLFALALFRRRGDDHLLFIGTAFAFAPAMIFPVLTYLDSLLPSGLLIIRDPLLARVLLSLLQSWAILVLTCAISVSKGLKIQNAAMIGLIIAYANILLLFVLGRIR